MKINQLLNSKTVLYHKYKEMLIQEDSEEFIQHSYNVEDSVMLLISDLLLFYIKKFHLLPNYLPLREEYPILLNWMKQKQNYLLDINHLDNSNRNHNYNDKSIHSSIELLLENFNNKKSDCSKYKLSKPNMPFIKIKKKRANESIESLEKFSHYIDNLDNHYFIPTKKSFKPMTPKKREKANVSIYALSNFFSTSSTQNGNNNGLNQITLKANRITINNPAKPKMILKKKITHRGNSDKFLRTEIFFGNLKEKEKNSFKFDINANKYTKMRRSYLKNNSSIMTSPDRHTLIPQSSGRKNVKGSLPCLSQERTNTNAKSPKSPTNTIDIKTWNKANRTKTLHLRLFSDSTASQFQCNTISSLTIKKRNCKQQNKGASILDNVNQLDSLIKTTFSKARGESLLQKKLINKKKDTYLNNIDRVIID